MCLFLEFLRLTFTRHLYVFSLVLHALPIDSAIICLDSNKYGITNVEAPHSEFLSLLPLTNALFIFISSTLNSCKWLRNSFEQNVNLSVSFSEEKLLTACIILTA